ncbi:MAG: ATP-binding cassette domain-containing protein [Bacteroidales bacterium]|nr:ATP-binding cassette domain-containing protein [Bacteroidales bacterium]
MEIRFSDIIPVPIPEKDIKQSEVWNRDICFNAAEMILIYADSGKGKTTLVNIIFGNRKDYSGDVFIDGTNVSQMKYDDISVLRRNKLSIVPQGIALFDELSMIENIRIKNRIFNFKTETEISQMIKLLGLEGFENRKAAKMSFGQKQRVSIIRALCQPFEFILLDEAFSHLDVGNTEIALNLIKSEANKQNAGILLTSLSSDFNDELIKYRV